MSDHPRLPPACNRDFHFLEQDPRPHRAQNSKSSCETHDTTRQEGKLDQLGSRGKPLAASRRQRHWQGKVT